MKQGAHFAEVESWSDNAGMPVAGMHKLQKNMSLKRRSTHRKVLSPPANTWTRFRSRRVLCVCARCGRADVLRLHRVQCFPVCVRVLIMRHWTNGRRPCAGCFLPEPEGPAATSAWRRQGPHRHSGPTRALLRSQPNG